MTRGRWGYTRATWPAKRIKAEVAEIRAAPSMVLAKSLIPVGASASQIVTKLAENAAQAELGRQAAG